MGDLIVAIFLNAVFWSIRLKHDSQGVKDEFGWILAGFFWSQRHSLFWEGSALVKAVLALFFLSACFRLFDPLSCRDHFSHTGDIDTKSVSITRTRVERSQNSPTQTLKPLLFPCRTTHTRLFPKKHSFSYSYLCVGIPIGWQGSLNSFLSVDFRGHLTGKAYKQWWPSWFSIMSSDYLNRGSHAAGLKGKLDDYLESQVCDWVSSDYGIDTEPCSRMRIPRTLLTLTWSPHLGSWVTPSTLCHSGTYTTKKKSSEPWFWK